MLTSELIEAESKAAEILGSESVSRQLTLAPGHSCVASTIFDEPIVKYDSPTDGIEQVRTQRNALTDHIHLLEVLVGTCEGELDDFV